MYRFSTTIQYETDEELKNILHVLRSYDIGHSISDTEVTFYFNSRLTFVFVHAALVDYYAGV